MMNAKSIIIQSSTASSILVLFHTIDILPAVTWKTNPL